MLDLLYVPIFPSTCKELLLTIPSGDSSAHLHMAGSGGSEGTCHVERAKVFTGPNYKR
jgi:hypothetical protein